MTEQPGYSRRVFLARIGVLGAVVGGASTLSALPAWASAPGRIAGSKHVGGSLLKQLVDVLRPLLDSLALDTMKGLVVFALPGPDQYSIAQGTPRSEPGAVEARGAEFLVQALDQFVPFPEELARPLAAAFSSALADIRLPVPNPLGLLPVNLVDNVDAALSFLLENDQTIPLSLAVAIMLNLLATQVDPLTATPGSPLGPFSRLSFAAKGRVFSMLEDADADLVASLDVHVPAPLRGSVSGIIRFLGGSLLEFAAFGAGNEWGVYDPSTRTLTARPVSWRLSAYGGGFVDGWDELKGYYQGRRQVTNI
jgi:hypothetical protein